jgi:hypothetical protein
MNIPQDTLQQVADEAFLPSSKIVLTTSNIFDDWKNQAKDRRAVIQHAISNPALAPFLAGGGEYTDMEIADAWRSANHTMPFVSEIKRFLAALPRRESPSIAEAEPAAQVPLGPEDCPPGSVFTFGAKALWITPLCVSSDGVGFPETEPNNPLIQKFSFELLQDAAKINTSIPDTGRWDANAWRSCSKPGK